MDPLSVAASIITILGAAKQTHKALLNLYKLKNAPQEILELVNEVSELQALLCLVQKATGDVSSFLLAPNDQELIKRLLESVRDPLNQFDSLITRCCRHTDANAAKEGGHLSLSFPAWLRSRSSIEVTRKKFSRAHHNISIALAALISIKQREDSRLILDIHELLSKHTKKTEAQSRTRADELMLYQQLSYAVIGWINGTVSSSDAAMISHRRIFAIAQSEELDASVHINPRSTRPHGLKNLGASLDHHSGTRDLVGLFASIRTLTTRGNCDWGCRCQCHTRQGVESPGRLTEVFGTLFYSHTGTSLLRKRSCNWSACAQKESASCQLTYHFPRWLIMGAVMFTTSYRTLGGVSVSWSISLPRAISASHKAWQCIENNQPHEFLQLLRARSISGNDIADDDGVSLLIYALKFRSHEIVRLLCDYGANPHLVDPRGISAYAYAQSILLIDRSSQRPNWSAHIDLPVDKPSVTDDLLFTPLHHVVIGLEPADLHQQLRLNKMYINTPDTFGRSLLHWAVIMGDSTAVEAILEHGASPNFVDRERMTPLHDIYQAPSSSQSLCGRLLLSKGAEVDALDIWGRTPFRIAVGYTGISADFLNVLISKGANINRRDIYAQSPLLKSIQGCKETTLLLLSHGADTEARDEYGNTPILEAIYRDRPDQFQMLLEHGAKTNEYFELKPGRRARAGRIHLLDFIVWYGSVKIMRVLEGSVKQHYHLSYPLDTFEQYRDFRLVNGRKAGVQEQQAFTHLLMKMGLSYNVYLGPSLSRVEASNDEDECEDDTFLDAHDYFLEQEV